MEQLLVGLHSGGLGASKADTENGVCSEARLIVGTVEFNHLLVDGTLFGHIHTAQLLIEHVVDILHGLKHTLAKILRFVAIAKLTSLVHARRCTRRNCSTTHSALFGKHLDFHCGIAARVENLAAPDTYNL